METFSTLLAIFAGNSPVPGEFPPQRPVTRSFDREAGDLRRHRGHYDVTVMGPTSPVGSSRGSKSRLEMKVSGEVTSRLHLACVHPT